MKAMILAAGLGTRLKPLTDHTPKALIRIQNQPMIAHVIKRLKDAGVKEIIINLHHYPDKIVQYLKQNNFFDLDIRISIEKSLLNTGGGLKKAAWFFNNSGSFILHNVDVISNIDLQQMQVAHKEKNGIATLAVRNRQTSRYLLFDENDQLIGWKSVEDNQIKVISGAGTKYKQRSFAGIHIISEQLLAKLPSRTNFSIIEAYLDLAEKGEIFHAFPTDNHFWLDLGKPESLKQAEQYFKSNM